MYPIRRIHHPISLACVALWLGSALGSASEHPDYLRDIKPILKEHCFACHGALQQQAGLRLDTAAFMRKGGDSGPAVMSGDAASSEIIQRIASKDPDQRMPAEGKPLTAEQIELVKRWIEQGAASPDNELPEKDPHDHWAFRRVIMPVVPDIRNANADIRNEIDAFIAGKLIAEGIAPQPPTAKHVLLRRVYLDLLGLPPTREELQAFLADQSPTAYEAVVDRLLGDPRHGERWARHWMDIWRYSDWYGRRHVPDVWNSAPQIWRWRDWIVRSLNEDRGYERMVREMLAADEICPADDDAAVATGYLIRNWYALNPNDWMRNIVEHTGKAFLGLTFNCAHCHDHKYDPIAQDDYFRFRAFFEPIYIRQDRVPGQGDPGPFQNYEYGKLRTIQRLGAVRVFDKSPDAPTWFYTGGDERNRVKDRGSISPGVPDFLRGPSFPAVSPIDLPTRAFYPGLRPAIIEAMLADARAALATAESHLTAAPEAEAPAAAKEQLAQIEAAYSSAVPEAEQAARPRRSAEAKLMAARAELASLQARLAADRAKFGETPVADVASLAREASQLERIAALRRAESEVLAQQTALAVAEAKPMTDKHRAKDVGAATKSLAAARTVLETAQAGAKESMSADYTPLGPMYPRISTGRRRALAEWMTSRDNPLTARVAVNHIWSHHFHQPLVASVTDFGRNGAKPTHPELLDWLAVEFMESGWSMKHLHRLIVTCAAYRRVSSTGLANTPDPENKLLWRMNAGRMEAEVLRDSILYVSGRLDSQMGGQELENGEALSTFRRSVYYSVFPEQGGMSSLGELFDAPSPLDCYRRTKSIVPQQALALTNSELIHQASAEMASSICEPTGVAFITAAFERILSRPPTASEVEACSQFLSNSSDIRGRLSLVRAILNHNDFVAIR